MKILVTGGKGQLGYDVSRLLQEKGHQVFSYGREVLDITNQNQVRDIMNEVQPEVVVHAGAYTKVDLAETEVDNAYKVNALGTRNLVIEAEKYRAKFIYISTDYVFDGQSSQPYNEFAVTNPQSVYGKSKLAGEDFVRQLSSRFFIVRTSWVYGKNGYNFVKTMLRLAGEREELNVVNDQVGCPTYTVDLAQFIVQLLKTEAYGTYHASNSGKCSWYEFACAIFKEAGIEMKVNPISSDQYPLPAPRPTNSVFDHMMIRLQGFTQLRPWQEALQEFIKDMKG